MRIRGFRILNYRSIRDSGYCMLASDLTLLAGKNESGKTAVLEALALCGSNPVKLNEDAIPIFGGAPSIHVVYELTPEEVNLTVSGVNPLDEVVFRRSLIERGIEVVFSPGSEWNLGGWVTEYLAQELYAHNHPIIEDLKHTCKTLSKKLPTTQATTVTQAATALVWDGDPGALVDDLQAWSESVLSSGEITVKDSVPEEEVAAFRDAIGSLWRGDGSEELGSVLAKAMPRHIFYSSFDDVLPFSIPIAEAGKNESVQDFATLANLDLDALAKMESLQQRVNLVRTHSNKVSEDFGGYWRQGPVELTARPDGDKLCIAVKDTSGCEEYQVQQRSKGFQWFLSFFLRVRARARDGDLIIIDEPGLFLHAQAQSDALRVLENLSKSHQIIFSTHSPYLIDAHRLDRVRLVEKSDDKGTKVVGSISAGADADSVTPIMTAIGLDLNHGFQLTRRRNLVVEGISDYYYLVAFAGLTGFRLPKDVGIIPCMGATRVADIVSVLIGWDLEYRVLLDADREGRRIAGELTRRLDVRQDRIALIPTDSDAAIEDILTPDDFGQYVLRNSDRPRAEKTSNSALIKNGKPGKVVLARQFFDLVRSASPPVLSKQSVALALALLRTAFGPWGQDIN